MALIDYIANSKGASTTLTVNDLTLRAVNLAADTRGRQVRVAFLDAQGNVAQEVVIPPNTRQSATVDFPARLVEILKADLTIKAYIVPPFAVFF